jgi:hypothetical protein
MKRYFALLFILLLISYFPITSAYQVVNPDAFIIFPNLQNFSGFGDYLQGLLQFKTIDLQPVRDLTFWIDEFVFKKFHLNISILHNMIWWTLSCFFVFKILCMLFPHFKKSTLLLITYCFAFYPLFSNTLAWGVARKHILAFFFLLLCVHLLMRIRDLSIKGSLGLCFFYVLSLLSQPIHVLFPLWGGIYLFVHKKHKNLKELVFFLMPSLLLMVATSVVNSLYYQKSQTYLANYSPRPGIFSFNPADSLLALGHYHFQLFFPYSLSFDYFLGNENVLWGLAFFLALTLFAYKKSDKAGSIWLLLGYTSLSVVLTSPNSFYDTYLITLVLGTLIFLLQTFHWRFKGTPILLFVLISIWAFTNFKESKKWSNPLSYAESSFERNSNCSNAINLQFVSYSFLQKVTNNLKTFVVTNRCFKIQIEGMGINLNQNIKEKLLRIESFVYLFEKDLPLSNRIEGLKRLSKIRFIFLFDLAILYIKEGMTKEADMVINEIIEKGKDLKTVHFDAVIAKFLHPYCSEKKWEECIRISKKFLHHEESYF